MMKLCIVACLIIAVSMASPLWADNAVTLSCSVRKPLDQIAGNPPTFEVSNIDLTYLNITIDTKGGGDLEGDGAMAINPKSFVHSKTSLLISATDQNGKDVPIKASSTGGSINGYVLCLYFLEDSTVRRGKEEAAFERALATDTHSDPNSVQWAKSNRDKAIAALDSAYSENRTGTFTVTASYENTNPGVPNQPRLWTGTARGTPINIRVLNKGSQFDQLLH